MILDQEIQRITSGRKVALLDDCYLYSIETPAHTFTNLIRLKDAQTCFLVPNRDHFDAKLALNVAAFAQLQLESIDRAKPITKLSHFEAQGYPFDTVVILNPTAHDSFVTESTILQMATYLAFPAFNCEFSGDEDADTVKLMRKKFVSTLDWRREPCPKISMRFNNAQTLARSVGSKWGLTTLDVCLHEIKCLPPDDHSFVELLNFSKIYCRIVNRGSWYHLTRSFEPNLGRGVEEAQEGKAEIDALIRRFAIELGDCRLW